MSTIKNRNIFALFLLASGLINIVAHYVSGLPSLGHLFNSDALYLPTLFSDIFESGGAIKDWFLTPAPYFLPDYLMFLPAHLLGPNTYSQIILFALIQVFLTFLVIWLIVRETSNTNSFLAAVTATLLLIWLAVSAEHPFMYIFNSAHHYGVFIAAILLSAVWLKLHDHDKFAGNRKALSIMLILAITYVATLSDSIFLIQFAAPLFATQLLVSVVRRDFSFCSKVLLIFVPLFSVLGIISYGWIVANQTRYAVNLTTSNLHKNLEGLYEMLHSVMANNIIIGIIVFVYGYVVLHSLIHLIKDKKIDKLSWVAIFSFASMCATFISLSLLTLPITSRYFISSFSWPILVVAIFLNNKLRNRFLYLSAAVSLPLLASMSYSSYNAITENGIKRQYYPSAVSCVDDVLERYNLDNGIAQYWDAKYQQNFSRLNLNIAQHLNDLTEMHWITSKKYFKQYYDFAIIQDNATMPYRISAEAIKRINGTPALETTCGSRSLLVYGKDKMRVRKIIAVGDSYTWKACELYTQIGEITPRCTMIKRDNAQTGHLTYGPYERLPAGEYTFEIAYLSSNSQDEIVGDWDIGVALPSKIKILGEGSLNGTSGAPEKITGNFKLEAKYDLDKVEIRTLAHANFDLELIHLRINRVKSGLKLMFSGDSFMWKGCELFSQIGYATSECTMKKKDHTHAGHITYGPYVRLPAGRYKFEIEYASSASNSKAVGEWDVGIALPDEIRLLRKGIISGTNGVTASILGDFILDSAQSLQSIEIRTSSLPDHDLEIIHLEIIRM